MLQTPEFWLILTPFGVYVGFFNSVSSLLTQILSPYGFSETQAGIAGGILIIVGLLSSAILSPFIDRSKHYLGTIRVLVPLPRGHRALLCHLRPARGFLVRPPPRRPRVLVEITYPFSPEIGTTMCWALGQFLGAVFVLVQDALKASASGDPPQNMRHALVFSAVVACVAAPFPLCIGLFGRRVSRRRLDVDRGLDLDGQSQLAVVQVVRKC
ncbi:hypothetical protein AOCH_007681 [Aspergillus ochraceoroseus]|uniref:Uncharacterized protein n=1 Tax=Aspergillus ochraceoroseus TaxID=138278 RepID=A0A0F8VHD0_9EURO|nr:hypothetical protein AOCH_007681 [Aspergillus ochraceoroseus]